ncbi:4a-hydroxytetrahydrobiopterin dehydratase [Candidatus Parcubacteria bacterium]|nr:MAG: 4a-hydroxytetrahydrobiopterin dehydratase [Candidatus Parcubacteria bacterium]
MDLTKKRCVPCEGGALPLSAGQIAIYSSKTPGWEVIEDKKLKREAKFKSFAEAMKFVNEVARLAETEGHHPDIHVFYNLVRLELTTHAIGGLSENDFILAAKINLLQKPNPA